MSPDYLLLFKNTNNYYYIWPHFSIVPIDLYWSYWNAITLAGKMHFEYTTLHCCKLLDASLHKPQIYRTLPIWKGHTIVTSKTLKRWSFVLELIMSNMCGVFCNLHCLNTILIILFRIITDLIYGLIPIQK